MAAGRLNWLGRNPVWSKGLVGAVRDKQEFLTIRRGGKDALALVTGDVVNIYIDHECVGQARVVALHRGPMSYFKRHYRSLLARNIGAKKWDQVLRDMQGVYGRNAVCEDTIISVIEMEGLGE